MGWDRFFWPITVFWKHGCPCPGHAIFGLCVWLQQQCHCCLADVEVFIQAHCKLPCQDQEELQSCATIFKWKHLCLWWVLCLWALWAFDSFGIGHDLSVWKARLAATNTKAQIQKRILQAQPILESFGNAVTMRILLLLLLLLLLPISCHRFFLWGVLTPFRWFLARSFSNCVVSCLYICLIHTLSMVHFHLFGVDAGLTWKEADKRTTGASSHWTRLSKVVR